MQELVEIARAKIESTLGRAHPIDEAALKERYPMLDKEGASFVTINRNGQLRGCIGSLIAHRRLLCDIEENAKAAAFKDPRFPPLSLEELDEVEIEISLLSEPKPLYYEYIDDLKSRIVHFEDGVILQKEGASATFLPQVWEQLSDFESFFTHLCAKAGLPGNCLEGKPDIFTYRVQKIKES